MNMKAFTTTAFCCEGKKWQHLELNVFNYSGLEYTVKLNSIKWKTGFMTAEMSEREKSQLKSIEYGKTITLKQFFKNKIFMQTVKKF